MDTTDPDISFDEAGVCNHCHDYDRASQRYVLVGDEVQLVLELEAQRQ